MATTRSEPQTAPRYRRLAGDERRRQVISVARDLFAQRPYPDVSTTDIARAAGVTHGLLTYHFGSKRNLYLAVLRSTMHLPKAPGQIDITDPDLDNALEDMTEWWLDQLESNAELWLAVLGARGMGRDPDVAELLDGFEHRARTDLVGYLTARDPSEAAAELWAIVAAWQSLAEATAVEWLKTRRLDRNQAKVLILEALRVLLKLEPAVRRAGAPASAR